MTSPVGNWVLDLERAYVAAYRGKPYLASTPRELAGAGAVASRYLAVGTPRSFAIVGDDVEAASASLEAHRTWFAPRDLRATNTAIATALGARTTSIAEALTADIVCVHAPLALTSDQLRRGTHVNALADVSLDDDLEHVAKLFDEQRGLPALAAGIVDGRQLDEITIFFANGRSR